MRLPLGIAGVVALTSALGDVLLLTVSREVGLQGILPVILITGVAIVLGRQAAQSWISRLAFVGGTAAFLAIMFEVPLLYLATWLEAKTADGFVFYSLSVLPGWGSWAWRGSSEWLQRAGQSRLPGSRAG